jgi:hypothetical protein
MTASKQDIREWFDKGVARKATHMLVICDTFDHEDYPVYVTSKEDARKRYQNPGAMERVMEVYNLSKDREQQLNKVRCFEF